MTPILEEQLDDLIKNADTEEDKERFNPKDIADNMDYIPLE